jgi:hypothetical protein
MGEMRSVYEVFVRIPEGNRPFRTSRRKWEDNIGMDLTEIGWKGVDLMHPAQDSD